MYHDDEPESGLATPGSLPDPMEAYKQTRSLFLTQRVSQASIRIDSRTKVMELKNQDVELPQNGDTLYWCRTFKLNDITRKHHLIRVSRDELFPFASLSLCNAHISWHRDGRQPLRHENVLDLEQYGKECNDETPTITKSSRYDAGSVRDSLIIPP